MRLKTKLVLAATGLTFAIVLVLSALFVSELMRQAAQGFTPSDDEQEINALIERVNASTKEANDALDDALSFVAESNKRIAAMAEGKH